MLPIEEAIVEKLRESGTCFIDDMVTHLSKFSPGDIFFALDRMSKDGRLLYRQLDCSTYQMSLGPQVSQLTARRTTQTTGNVTPGVS